jgi:hypothetical protein
MMPRLDPRPGEDRVIDEARLGEAIEHSLCRLLRHATPAEGVRELSPRAGFHGEQPQADLPRGSLGIGRRESAGRVGGGALPAMTYHLRLRWHR